MHPEKRISLIPETIGAAAIRADPGDAVAGHAPEIVFHAVLADAEIAVVAVPQENLFFAAAMAASILELGFSFLVGFFFGYV